MSEMGTKWTFEQGIEQSTYVLKGHLGFCVENKISSGENHMNNYEG